MTPTDLTMLEYAAGALVHDPPAASEKIRQYMHWIKRFYNDTASNNDELLKALDRLQEIQVQSRTELIDAVSTWQNSGNLYERNAHAALLSALLEKLTEDILEDGNLSVDNQRVMERISCETQNTDEIPRESINQTKANRSAINQGQ